MGRGGFALRRRSHRRGIADGVAGRRPVAHRQRGRRLFRRRRGLQAAQRLLVRGGRPPGRTDLRGQRDRVLLPARGVPECGRPTGGVRCLFRRHRPLVPTAPRGFRHRVRAGVEGSAPRLLVVWPAARRFARATISQRGTRLLAQPRPSRTPVRPAAARRRRRRQGRPATARRGARPVPARPTRRTHADESHCPPSPGNYTIRRLRRLHR